MADTQTTVTNLDIQLLDESRSDTTTFKLDNPKNDVTREQVSSAMQPALTNGWLLTNKGNVAMYLGDITINQSIKTKLGGEDFYVDPASVELTGVDTRVKLIHCVGAVIQGYRFDNVDDDHVTSTSALIDGNGLTLRVSFDYNLDSVTQTIKLFDAVLIVQGTAVAVPFTATPS